MQAYPLIQPACTRHSGVGHISARRRLRPCRAVDYAKEDLSGKKVLVIGGTGRVGSSTAEALVRGECGVEVRVASRSEESYDAMLERRPALNGIGFVPLDINSRENLQAALEDVDLVIHAAGPFQQTTGCPVLEAAIETNTSYLDVCDDPEYALRAKQYHTQAQNSGIRAITTGGIYPGMSNLMAAHIVSSVRGEYTKNFEHKDSEKDALEPQRLRYSYYTAGSGGVGPTLITTTFMLLGEPVVAFKEGKKVTIEPLSQRTTVDFGPGIGRRSVALLQLPEVLTSQQVLQIPSVSARFGTSPDIFNGMMWLVARLFPKSMLQDPSFAETLGKISTPFIKAADLIVGEAVAMRVDLEFNEGKKSSGVFVHPKMSSSIGVCVSAFARCMLSGGTKPGVWFPEEKQAVSNRKSLFTLASKGCSRLLLNKSEFMIESGPTQVGLGFYV